MPDGSLLRLDHRSPLAAGRVLAFLGARAIPGVERVGEASFARSMRTHAGAPVVIELEPDPDESCVRLRVAGAVLSLAGLAQAARRLFDLDADPGVIDAALARDAMLRPLVRDAPGTRVPGTIDGFELAVRAIVGQQVSVAGARTTLGRIAERFGEPLHSPAGSIVRLFPTPQRLAEAPSDAFGMPRSRAETIGSVARAVSSGELDLSGSVDMEATLNALRSIKGVGEWTAAYIAMRALRDPDAFPLGDLGLRRSLSALGVADDPTSIRERAERWRPWRAYAAMHLWSMSG